MEDVLTQLEAAVAELAPQLKALRTATSALNRAARLAAAPIKRSALRHLMAKVPSSES